MRCPTLDQLPPPPSEKTGWPWTEESPWLPDTLPGGRPWPQVSIVTPSYNQAHFLEETIRSVLLQGYPNLEYLVIDGGSIDDSVEIIRKYEPWLAYWVSESDRGQSHAINKGFARTAGEIYAWLNSDDTYEPGAITAAANYLAQHPATGVVFGKAHVIDEASRLKREWHPPPFDLKEIVFLQECYVPQVSVFFRRDPFEQVGGLNEEMYWTMDYDLWFQLGKITKVDQITQVMGNYREHDSAKTVIANRTYDSRVELLQCLQRLFDDPALPSGLRALEAQALGFHYLNWGLALLQVGRNDEARRLMSRAFEAAPTLVEDCSQRVLGSLVVYTKVRSDLSRSYANLQKVFQHLPKSASSLRSLYQRAADRLLIIEASQNRDERLVSAARKRVLGALIRDGAWFKHKSVLTSVACLFSGPLVLRILLKACRWMRQGANIATNGS